ncbi:hypothetical protein [Aquimarina litoralis]|uniref:hypothetical protein n=1 Tax=Aquimarina litoralis TaxID=584605 RepID=UPI001C56059B|nr:hypothetical protein [Aquimarina litoralis]MBW1295069.1 hypothetical protein [Aquimarina litoralis]
MKKLILLLFTFSIFCSSCSNDDDGIPQQQYKMQEANDSGISGSAFFAKSSSPIDGVFLVDIQLMEADIDAVYTAFLYENSLSEGGDVIFRFRDFYNLPDTDRMSSANYFDSSTQLTFNNEVLTYQDLIAFDGHIKIYNSNDLSTPIAEGNIGSNTQ